MCDKHDDDHEVEDLICSGFWPGTLKRIRYVFDIQLLEWFDILCKCMPGTSLSAFVQALRAFSPDQVRSSFYF